ncbi:LOW QUALITY PROTEIN: methyltransferase-like protein 27 [Lampetra planeri]
MSGESHTFEHVRDVILSVHENTTPAEKINFYDTWAKCYDQDVAVLEYRAPTLAANSVASHFSGDRETAVVLDVACGTGLVAKKMKQYGFGHFKGVDGSEAMLEEAKRTGLYEDLRLVILGQVPLPAHWELFDAVMIVGALSAGHIPVSVIRELCKAAKPGGYICMTTRGNKDNVHYKTALESEIKQMEKEGLWTCVEVNEVKDWERGVAHGDENYISGAVYLCRRL